MRARINHFLDVWQSDQDWRVLLLRRELQKPRWLLLAYALLCAFSTLYYLLSSGDYPRELRSLYNYVHIAAVGGVALELVKLSVLVYQRKKTVEMRADVAARKIHAQQQRTLQHGWDMSKSDPTDVLDVDRVYEKREKMLVQSYYESIRFIGVSLLCIDLLYQVLCICLGRSISVTANVVNDGGTSMFAYKWIMYVNTIGSVIVYASLLTCYPLEQLNDEIRQRMSSTAGSDEQSTLDRFEERQAQARHVAKQKIKENRQN